MEQHRKLIIKGARTHNLKNVDITLPRDKMIVVSGVSGSGKSSLAFDTIYAEGQRRYVESLSPYARQFLGLMEKPDLDYIEGLSPAISIEQKTTHKNPRSTVATVTEVHDYLRLLFARTGVPYCYKCGKAITAQSVDQIVDLILSKDEGTKIMILAPVVRGRKGEFQKIFEDARKSGYMRVAVDGELYTLDEEIKLDKQKKHTIEIVVDRLVIRDGIHQRCSESVESALKMANGLVTVDVGGEKEIFSEHFACPDCGISYPEIQPRLFSFNNPQGACEACHGLGEIIEYDLNKIIPDRRLSIADGAIQTHQQKHKVAYAELESLSRHFNFDLDVPFEQLPENIQDIIINGTDEEIEFRYEMKVKKGKYKGIFEELKQRYREAMWGGVKEWLESFMTEQKCHSCHGKRLNKIALSIKVADKNIDDVVCHSVKESYEFFENLKLSDNGQIIAVQILKEIRSRLRFLMDVGLEYLTLDRKSATLSGGEAQRIRLATQIGSKLVGVLYVLDEPTIGLHQRDNDRLLQTLLELRDIGNTLVIVEHDEQVIRSADYVVDLGPRAGEHGGMIIAEGTPSEIEKNPESITGRFLSGADSIEIPQKRREGNGQFLTITGAKLHNLKNITVSIPLGKMTIITGVSGSGKSTLVNEIIYPALFNHLFHKNDEVKYYKSISGIENIDKVICIDQSPIGRTPRSNPATYTGLFNHIRDLFAEMEEAKIRGYKSGRFSFNVKGGRCESCCGDGQIKIEMHFLPDVYVTCETCNGMRYNRETLEVKYKGYSISDVLNMTAENALKLFEKHPQISKKLQTLCDVGLGYIRLGQSALTLSGGEAQRVKLADELSKRQTGKTMYILDEPTTGLHFADVKQLVEVLNKLVDQGNSMVIIEHNLDVIKIADHIIDIGPEGGDKGGQVVVAGTPEEVAACEKSYTGHYLKDILKV